MKEERFRLLDNSTSVHYKNSSPSPEGYGNTEEVYNSSNSKMEFHCHSISTSTGKERQESSRAAKQKLFIACFLVLLFICLEVSAYRSILIIYQIKIIKHESTHSNIK